MSANDRWGYSAIGASAIVSALGWFTVDRWIPIDADGSAIAVAVFRTMFAILPAVVGFAIADRRQRRTHRQISSRLINIRNGLTEFQRIHRIEHELNTMDRLARVAREAVKRTVLSSTELLGAIEAVSDPHVKERLIERYRHHTNNVATVLSAVNDEMDESGRSIQRELTADDSIHILEREKGNTARGIEHAKELMEQRGIADGLKQLSFAAEQASKLQADLETLRVISAPAVKVLDHE